MSMADGCASPTFSGRAAGWFLASGIQAPNGGMARYYRVDLEQHHRISTEITGYGVSTFVYLHSQTGQPVYLDRAIEAAHFLTRIAWDPSLRTFPFEFAPTGSPPAALAFFFDCGIIARGLLALWRVTRDPELLEVAEACGRSMAADFRQSDSLRRPVLRLPEKLPLADGDNWSRRPGCYQLKAALAWQELSEATGNASFETHYQQLLESALGSHESFLPGAEERSRVMDRLHAYCYFLEGLLPVLAQARFARALHEGIERVSHYLQQIAPSVERCDVYAQVLRLRLFADIAGVSRLDRTAARQEAEKLTEFQGDHADVRIRGGLFFGRQAGELLPYVNPAATAFSLQALSMWREYQAGNLRADWRALI